MGVKLRQKQLKGGRISLYLDVYHKGKRNYEFLDLYLVNDKKKDKETEKLAETIRSKREIELYNNKYDFEPADQSVITFTDFLKNIDEQFRKKNNRNYDSLLKQVIEYKGRNVDFDSINESWVHGFKDHLLNNLKQSTARIYFLMFRAVLNKAMKRGVIKENPIYKYEIENIPKDPPKIDFLNDTELTKLQETDIPNTEVKLAFLFSVNTGLRFSDVVALKWNDIIDVGGYRQVQLVQKKTKESITVPLNQKAESLINQKRVKTEKIFDINVNSINYWLPKWRERSGLSKHLHFHMARHTFATRLLQRGAKIHEVSKLLGHSSISSTEKYLHVVDQDKKSAVDLL